MIFKLLIKDYCANLMDMFEMLNFINVLNVNYFKYLNFVGMGQFITKDLSLIEQLLCVFFFRIPYRAIIQRRTCSIYKKQTRQ